MTFPASGTCYAIVYPITFASFHQRIFGFSGEPGIAAEKRRRAVIDRYSVAPLSCPENLCAEGTEDGAEHRLVLGDDRLDKGIRIRLPRTLLQGREPTGPVEERLGRQGIVPDAGGVPKPGLVPVEHTCQLVLSPSGTSIHDVHVNVSERIVPFVAGLPEAIVDLAADAVMA